MSFAQQRLWFLDQLDPGNAAYNIPLAVCLQGELNVHALEGALREVERRHEVLRTRFVVHGNEPRQVIDAPHSWQLQRVDLEGLPAGALEREQTRLAEAEARAPFELSRGPLWRAVLLSVGAREHVLLLTQHHIVSDGWSQGVLVREVTALYAALAEGTTGQPSPLAELPVQYADFAAWQRSWLTGDVLEGELQYWRDRLSGAPPVLELPADRPRPAVQSFRGAVRPLSLSPELSAALAALSRREGATLFMTLVSALGVLLSRLTGQADLTLGTVVAGRRRLEIENLIGFFVNTLVLRPDLSAAPRFPELLARVRREALDAYAHQDLPFEKLVEDLAPERSLSATPLFQVMFAWQNVAVGDVALPGLRLAPLKLLDEVAKFDVSLSLQETGGVIGGSVSYSTDLFDGTTIARWIGQLEAVLRAWVDTVDIAMADLPLLSAGERQQVLVEWSSGSSGMAVAATGSLWEQFAAVAAERPEAAAVMGDEAHLTYGELAARSRGLARWLRRSGVVPGERVGLQLERSPEMIVGILGVLAAGAAYVPLDPAYPEERLSFILADSGARIVVRREEISGAQATPGDEAGEDLSLGPDDLAYLIYTSGSTGRPKGVGVTHGNVLSLLGATASGFGLGPHDVWTLFHSYAFDF
ncbi:MAG TPA: condensation domain-containing protein, partial [Thermoanaerobaculia bacterium]